MSFAKILISVFLICYLPTSVIADQVEILTTSKATTDLAGWHVETFVDGSKLNGSLARGWDEISFHYRNKTGRGFQICPNAGETTRPNSQSWLRSPALNVTGISRIYVSFKFWMRECYDLKDTICRETFKVYYRSITPDENTSSDAVDLSEKFYTVVDTVAAEVRFLPNKLQQSQKINHEVVSISMPESSSANPSKGIYVAIVDKGACIAMAAFQVYYVVCPQIIFDLVRFPETHTGPQDTSLIEVEGVCVDNATRISTEILPVYRCASSGEWKVPTGSCHCVAGFQPDKFRKKCLPCPHDAFKSSNGNEACKSCPPGSATNQLGSTQCQCSQTNESQNVNARTNQITSSAITNFGCTACSQLPSIPTHLTIDPEKKSPGKINLHWEYPKNNGSCKKVTYCVVCRSCSSGFNLSSKDSSFQSTSVISNHSNHRNCWRNVSSILDDQSLSRDACKFLSFEPRRCQVEQFNVTVDNLHGYTDYTFTVVAVNGVTMELYSDSLSKLQDPENMSANPIGQLSLKQQLQTVLEVSGTSISYRTGETKPSIIMGLKTSSHLKTSVLLHWNPPQFANGVITLYEVWYWSASTVKGLPLRSLHASQANVVTCNVTSFHLKSLVSATKYFLAVRAKNSAGFSKLSDLVQFSTTSDEPKSDETGNQVLPSTVHSTIYLIAAGVFLFSLIVTLTILWFKCNSGHSKQSAKNGQYPATSENSIPNGSEVQTACTTVTDDQQRTYVDPYLMGALILHTFSCETLPELVTAVNVIGCGEFGEVYQGTLTRKCDGADRTIVIAVKRLHAQCQPNEQLDFLREAMALERFQHPHIVKLEAVVMRSRPFMIVTELMDHGCLGAFLRAHGVAHKAFPAVVLVRMMAGVARGMEYLSRLQYVHRDLAARNVLINSDLVCKVADFGLTRHLDEQESETDCACPIYTTQGGKIAIRWTAPEAVAFRLFSQASDVWSFGVFVWEVVTYGEKPYWNLTNQQVLKAVNDGFRLPGPEDCPSVIHQLMLSCWLRDRHARPTFVQLVCSLDNMLNEPETLQAMTCPVRDGAEETFFVDSSSAGIDVVPTIKEGQLHHDYATCQIVAEDNNDFDSIKSWLPKPSSDRSEACETSDTSNRATCQSCPEESSSLLEQLPISTTEETEQSPLVVQHPVNAAEESYSVSLV